MLMTCCLEDEARMRSVAGDGRRAQANVGRTMSVWTIVVAAGRGDRFGGDKQVADLSGRPVLARSVATAAEVSDGVVVVAASDRRAAVTDLLVGIEGVVEVVAGGSTRASSVRAGLAAVPDEATVVLVHDGARPLASVDLFRRVASGVGEGVDAVVPGVAVSDSLRAVTGGALDREEVIAVQTPQAFSAWALRDAHRLGGEASDDASLVEAAGGTVVVVEGEATNAKITVPLDLVVAELSLGSARPDHGGGMVVGG